MADSMGGFWDERARENAAFFVDDRLDYRDTDLERFWAGGERAVDDTLAAVEAPPLEPRHTVLEVGCGIGRLTRVLAARAGRVIALDVSAEMLTQARGANPGLANVEWRHGDGTTLSGVPDASVDVVFSLVVFQHIPDPAITLGYVREMGRVLRPGGWTAFQVSTDPAVHRRSTPLRLRAAAALGRAPKGRTHPAWMGSAVEPDALQAAAGQAGLRVERMSGVGTQFCIVRLGRPA